MESSSPRARSARVNPRNFLLGALVALVVAAYPTSAPRDEYELVVATVRDLREPPFSLEAPFATIDTSVRAGLTRFCDQESYAAEFQGIVAVLGTRAYPAIVAWASEELESTDPEAPWQRDACNELSAKVESVLVMVWQSEDKEQLRAGLAVYRDVGSKLRGEDRRSFLVTASVIAGLIATQLHAPDEARIAKATALRFMGKDLDSAFASFPALSTLDRYEWDTIETTDDATAQSARAFPDDPPDDDEP